MTFIDTIFKEQKLRGIPGAGKYNLEIPLAEKLALIDEEKKKKVAHGERPNYLHEYQYMADFNPGPGQYNPRVQFIHTINLGYTTKIIEE
jgi:hypothetical protein